MPAERSLEPPEKNVLKLLHLGDSYTASEGVASTVGWPSLLRQELELSESIVIEQRIIAQTGWTTGELIEAIEEAKLHQDWDLISLCIGVNNQYRGMPVTSFTRDLEALIRVARTLLNGPSPGLHLFSIPDWGVSPYASDRDIGEISRQVDTFNEAMAAIANELAVPFHDWTPLSRSFAGDPSAFAPDGLHPSAIQHREMSCFLLRKVLLKDRGPRAR